jgi:hypothetical protein
MRILAAIAEDAFELVSLVGFLTTIIAGLALAAGHLPI